MTPSVIAELIRQKQLPKPFVQPDVTASLPMGAPSGATAPVGTPPVTAPPVPEPGPVLPPAAPPTLTAPPTQWTPPPPSWIAPPPLQYNVPPPSPLMEESNKFHSTEPARTDPQFHQGKLATILDVIASSLAGAGPGGAKAGIETAHTLRDIPFNRAHADWAQRATDYDRRIKEEQSREGIGLKVLGSEVTQRRNETTAEAAAKKLQQTGDIAKDKLTQQQEHDTATAAYRKARLDMENKHKEDELKLRAEHNKAYAEDVSKKETPDQREKRELRVAGLRAAARQGDTAARATLARSDKSYQFNVGELNKIGKPVADLNMRLGRLQDTLAQNSPQADALIAPELLSVMAGGTGSGIRMNEAEIHRIVGGRSNWESLKAAINQWQIDPKSARSITTSQQKQIRDLTKTVADKLNSKQAAIDEAHQGLSNSDDPKEHRRLVNEARKKFTSIDTAPQDEYKVLSIKERK